MAGIVKSDVKSVDTAKYVYCSDSVGEYLFCASRSKSKITLRFRHEVLDYFFLISKTGGAVYVVLENGIVGLRFSRDIRYSFNGGYLVFQIHSIDLFDELIDFTFYRRDEVNCGGALENNLFGLGILVTGKNSAENAALDKMRRLSFFTLVSFLICNNESKLWGIEKTIIKSGDFHQGLELGSKDFKNNMRAVMAFYLNSPQQSTVIFSGNALKNDKNIFFVFLFASYVFYEDNLCHALFSFHGEAVLSVLQMRKRLSLYINNLIENKSFLTAKNFYSELEEFGFFIGAKSFLFFHLNKFCRSKKLNGTFFLLKEKCFAPNVKKYNLFVDGDWGIALLRGACVPIELNGKYQLILYPDIENEILFEHKTITVSATMSEREINIAYNFPLLEKIIVIISPFRIRKMYKNGEYAPLIVEKNNDCVEINSGVAGNITMYIG